MSTDIRFFGTGLKRLPLWLQLAIVAVVTSLGLLGSETSPQAIDLAVQDAPIVKVDTVAHVAPLAPVNDGSYTVKAGDTLSGIALAHGKDWRALAQQNKLANADKLAIGQTLIGVGSGGPAVSVPVVNTANVTPARNNIPKGTCAVPASAWKRVAEKESNNRWSINTGNGYYGGLQFSATTWRLFGGTGMPHNASEDKQMEIANRTLAHQGWGAWPNTSRTSGVAAEYPTSVWCNR